MDNFQNMLKTSLEYKKKREEQTKEVSKARLYKNSKKKILTTMIGALATMEKYFGFLWGQDEDDITPEQEQLKMIYDEVRSEILDKGNTQIRNLESEFAGYDIIWKKNTLVLPFKEKGAKDE